MALADCPSPAVILTQSQRAKVIYTLSMALLVIWVQLHWINLFSQPHIFIENGEP